MASLLRWAVLYRCRSQCLTAKKKYWWDLGCERVRLHRNVLLKEMMTVGGIRSSWLHKVEPGKRERSSDEVLKELRGLLYIFRKDEPCRTKKGDQ